MVVAAGKKAFLSSRTKCLSPPTLAIYAYWENSAIGGVESRVEAFNDGWLWGAPLPRGLYNIALFTNPDSRQFSSHAEIKQYYLKALDHPSLNRPVAYLQNIELAPLIQFIENQHRTSRELVFEWGRHIGLGSAYRVLKWLLAIKAVKPVDNETDIA